MTPMEWIYSQARLLLLAPAVVLALAVHMAAKPHAPLPWRSEAPPRQIGSLVGGAQVLRAVGIPWPQIRQGSLGWMGLAREVKGV